MTFDFTDTLLQAEELVMLNNASELAKRHLTKPRRSTGTALTHGVWVAKELAKAGQPSHVIAAGLLHDLLEDSSVTVEELRKALPSPVCRIIEALTKLGPKAKHERRYLNAIMHADDKNVIIVKLIDNAHNLSECMHLSRPKEYIEYGKKIQAIGVLRLGENNSFVLRHLKALRDAEVTISSLQ